MDYSRLSKDQIIGPYIRYRNQYGLQDASIGKVSQNPVRFTAQYLYVLAKFGKLSVAEKDRISSVIPWKEKGLLRRDPTSEAQDSVDNYIGLGLIALFCNNDMAKSVLEYGQKNWRFYNNVEPGRKTFRSFLGRFPGLFAHLKWSCGQKPNFIELFFWCLSIWLAPIKATQDDFVLSWMLCIVGRNHSYIADWFIKRFVAKFKLQHPHGIGQVLSDYYQNPEHPDVLFLWDEFGG